MKNLKVEQVSEDISRALDQMNIEIARSTEDPKPRKITGKKMKTREQRREKHLTTGAISLFSGIGLAIFLYYLSAALVLKLPPDVVAKVPFEIEPVVRMIWLVGLMPALSGVGHLLAGILVRPDPPLEVQAVRPAPLLSEGEPIPRTAPVSVTERTTNLLERQIREGGET